MKKVNLLSRAEMKKVLGGTEATACATYAANNYNYPDTITCFNCNYPNDMSHLTPNEQTIILDNILAICERHHGAIPPITP